MRRNDLVAGLSVAGLMLPEAVAYAGIAGLPPQRAIYAGVAGCLFYALLGRSRFAIVAPTSSAAAILAATLAAMPGGAAEKALDATILVGLTGLLFLLASALRLGGLTGFISRPVLRGFAFGLAITIAVRQLPLLVGAEAHAPDVFRLATALLAALPAWNPASVAIGLIALASLLLIRRYRFVPGAFLVLAAGIAASAAFGLGARGVALVGTIDLALGWPELPWIGLDALSRLAQFALPLVLILFAESWGTIRALALRHGDRVEANRELGALGLANLAAFAVQGMPVGAGFSAGSASEAAHAGSRATGIVAAVAVGLLILFAGGWIALLPEPVLAAVVIAALAHALDPAPLIRLWRLDRDQYVALGAAAGVLALGVLNGMLLAIALSLAALVQRMAFPHVARLGRRDGGHVFVDLARHPDAVSPPGIAIWRPAEPLFFANAERVLGEIARGTLADPEARAVVISLEESFDLDSTALDALSEGDAALRAAGRRVALARVHDRVRDLLVAARGDLPKRSFYSVDEAVGALAPAAAAGPEGEVER